MVADLEELGLLVKIEDHRAAARHAASAARPPVEPLVSTQWFVKTKPLAETAIRVVEDGRIQLVPENWTKTYYEWMYNIRDWCISRQLWWGHRIPAWHCQRCGEMTVAREDPTDVPALRLRRTSSRIPTCSTPGSAPGCGRSRRSAGPIRPTISRRSIRPRC